VKDYQSQSGVSTRFFKDIVENEDEDDEQDDDRPLDVSGRSGNSVKNSIVNSSNRLDRSMLTTTLINHTGETFELKGPLGRGLRVKKNGVHIVFAAGTGVLCFVDLVAQVALAMMELDTVVLQGEDCIDLNDFKLVMYVSFKDRSDAIALELLYALSDFCMQI